jgi:hypothetical protein
MDRLVRIFHGGTVKKNKHDIVEFPNMLEMVLVFHNFPSLAELVDRVKGKLDWLDSVLHMHKNGIVDVGSSKGPRTQTRVHLDSHAE